MDPSTPGRLDPPYGTFVPFVAGGGAAVRGAKIGTKAVNAIDNASDAARAIDRTHDYAKTIDKAWDAARQAENTHDYAKTMGMLEKTALHGNDLRTTKLARGYSLRHTRTGEILKYGETTRGTKRYSQAWLDRKNARMVFEARGTKREMHIWQHDMIVQHRAMCGKDTLPLNLNGW